MTECCCQVGGTPSSYVVGPDWKFGLESSLEFSLTRQVQGSYFKLGLGGMLGENRIFQQDCQFLVQDLNLTHVECKVGVLSKLSFASSGNGVVHCDKPSGM